MRRAFAALGLSAFCSGSGAAATLGAGDAAGAIMGADACDDWEDANALPESEPIDTGGCAIRTDVVGVTGVVVELGFRRASNKASLRRCSIASWAVVEDIICAGSPGAHSLDPRDHSH